MATTPPHAPRRGRAATPEAAQTPAVVLSGPPSSLRGHTSMANSSDQRIAVRGGDLRLEGRAPVSLSMGVVLPAGAESDVALGADVGSATPPGTYAGSLDIGGISRPVVVRVEEVVALDVTPDALVATEGRTEARVRVRNEGNTAIRLAPLVRGRLRAHDVDAANDAPDERAPDAELRVVGPHDLVEPGAEIDVDVVVVVPKGLDPTRRHRAVLPLGPADVVVTVLPWGVRTTSTATRTARTSKKSAAPTTRSPSTRRP